MASGCLRLWFYGDGWADPLGELALIGRAAETEIIDRLLGDAFSGREALVAPRAWCSHAAGPTDSSQWRGQDAGFQPISAALP